MRTGKAYHIMRGRERIGKGRTRRPDVIALRAAEGGHGRRRRGGGGGGGGGRHAAAAADPQDGEAPPAASLALGGRGRGRGGSDAGQAKGERGDGSGRRHGRGRGHGRGHGALRDRPQRAPRGRGALVPRRPCRQVKVHSVPRAGERARDNAADVRLVEGRVAAVLRPRVVLCPAQGARVERAAAGEPGRQHRRHRVAAHGQRPER